MTASRSILITRQPLALVLGLVLGLVLATCLVAPAAAQEVPFRLVHQGNLLPEGTAVVVLEEAVDPSVTGRIQPRFIDRDEYPRDPAAISFRDTLSARGRTDITFPRTQSARVLYFLYARTPDDAIYWSYSAQEGQLKFDVVQTGAMSVAPAPDDAAAELRRLFFDPAPEASIADAAPAETGAAPDTSPDEAPATPETSPPPSDDALEAPTDVAPSTDAAPAEDPSDAAAEPAAPGTTPDGLTLALALLSAVLLGALLLLYRRYRALKDGVSDADVMQAELAAAREQLQEYRHLEAEHKVLQDKYDTVRQHCDTLLEQHDRLRAQLQEAQKASPEAPDQSPRA